MKKFLLLLINIIPLLSFSQSMINIFENYQLREVVFKKSYTDVKGSPYMHDTFKKGFITRDNKIIAKSLQLRYNIYHNEIEIKVPNKGTYNLPKDIGFHTITIENDLFVLKKNPFNKKGLKCMQLLYKNKLQLLKYHRMKFNKEQPPLPYKEKVPACFKRIKPIYFISSSDNQLIHIKSFKDLTKKFPEISKLIKKEYKQNNLKFEDNDLIKLILFIETKL